jgi:rare lipoprotein A
MRSYVVKKKRYTPHLVKKGTKQYGISSWYGPNFHGKYTSSGEIYNMYARTAAHKTFPMDTIVRVTNIRNGKSTVVRINDRGPFVAGRIIDCSYKAGKEIGLDIMGIAKVQVEVLGMVKLNKPKLIGIKLGTYRVIDGAYACRRRYVNSYVRYTPIIKKLVDKNGMVLYKVWLVGFKTTQELKNFKLRQNQLARRI